MNAILSYPKQAYKYIEVEFGTLGLIIAGVLCVGLVLLVFTWFDRKK
ncbi:MAG: hypothetical protein R3B84_09365 [Zavarzinella sp.]